MKELAAAHQLISQKVGRFGRFRWRWRLADGWSRFVLLAPGLLLLWGGIDWLAPIAAWPLVFGYAALAGVWLWAAFRYGLRPLLSRIALDREAVTIESLDGSMDNRLIGCLQLGREALAAEAAGKRLGHSLDVVVALVQRTADALRRVNLKKLLDLKTSWRMLTAATVVMVAWAAVAHYGRAEIAARIEHLVDAWATVLDDLFPVEMEVQPGDKAVVRGRPVTLSVKVRGARRDTILLIRTPLADGGRPSTDSRSTALKHDVDPESKVAGSPDTVAAEINELTILDGVAEFTVPAAEQHFIYQFEYASRRTPPHTILVGDLPEINAINYELAYPAYTGMPSRTIVGRVRRLHALMGTNVLVSFASTTELHPEMCHVEWSDGQVQRITVNGRFGHFPFTVDRPDRAMVRLTGQYGAGFEMESPLSFEVELQRDQRPTIRILGISAEEEEMIVLAGEATSMTIAWLAEDDFGITDVNLQYKVDTVDPLLNRPLREGELPRAFDPPLDRVRGKYQQIFNGLDPPLAPGDRIAITLTAKDNDTENGPNLGRSRTLTMVVVSPDLRGFVGNRDAGFGSGEKAAGLLAELERDPRALNLLVSPEKTIRTEPAREMEKKEIQSRVTRESSSPGNEDSVSNYFDLLSGQQ